MDPMIDPAPAVEIRPAATLMLVRDGADGIEVLMLRRNPLAVFAADAWVFPGGAVDPSDGKVSGPLGLTDSEASATLGLPSAGLAYFVAAARECFEEAGVLLARRAGDGAVLETTTEMDGARFARHRRDVLAGRRSLAEVLAAEDLVLDLSGMAYVSHWITPPGPPRRFDTRFFLALAPAGQAASHDMSETVESVWTTPASALERRAAGEIHLVFPTIRNLEALARFPTAAEVLAAARAIDGVQVTAPGRLPHDPELPCPT